MGRATILDAFNAAAGFTQQILHHETDKLKERIDILKKNEVDLIQTYTQNWIRDNPFVGSMDREDDAKAYHEYVGKLNEYINEQYAISLGKNNSAYYQKTMEQMRTGSLEMARGYALEEEDKWRISREDLSREEDINRILDAGWDPQRTLEAIYNRITLSGYERPINPQQRNEMRRIAEMMTHQRYAINTLERLERNENGLRDVNDLEAAMREINEAFAFMPSMTLNTYDEHGNITGTEERPWSYDGKDEWEKKLIESETRKIQGEHFEFFREKQAYMDRMLISGKDINEIIEYARKYGAQWNRYYNLNNSEFVNSNDDFRWSGSRFFDYRNMEEHVKLGNGPGGGGPSAARMRILMAQYNMEMFLNPRLTGDGTVTVGYYDDGFPITVKPKSFQEAIEYFIFFDGKAYEAVLASQGIEPGGALSLQLLEARRAEHMNDYYGEVGKTLKRIAPSLGADFEMFRQRETYLNSRSEFYNGTRVEGLGDRAARERYAQNAIDFFQSMIFNGIENPEVLREQMRIFTGTQIMNLMPPRNYSNDAGERAQQFKLYSDGAMSPVAEHIIFVRHKHERLQLGMHPDEYQSSPVRLQPNVPSELRSYSFVSPQHEQAVYTMVEEERRQTVNLMRQVFNISRDSQFDVNNIVPYWMPSDLIKGEIIPKAMFVVESGPAAGTYYLDYDDNANRVLMRQTPQGWERVGEQQRQSSQTERTNQRNQTEQNFNRFYEVNNQQINTLINQGRNPFNGELHDYTRPPPGVSQRDWDTLPQQGLWINYWREQAINGRFTMPTQTQFNEMLLRIQQQRRYQLQAESLQNRPPVQPTQPQPQPQSQRRSGTERRNR